jgi:RNA polymerase sigma-70 factor, ECF subfamily
MPRRLDVIIANNFRLAVANARRRALLNDDMNSTEQENAADWTDREYVESSRNGCPDHFRVLVQRYQKPLFTFLSGRVGNRHEAEEVAQESFVRAFFSLKKLRKPESFYSWLLGIAGRVVKEQFRSTARRERNREAAEAILADANGQEDYPLEEAIAALPEAYRQVILLRYYEGLSCQEVATRLGLPLGTATKTLSRAYALLRRELATRDGEQVNIQTNRTT